MKLYAFNLGMPLLWLPNKLLLTMKLTVFIFIICIVQVTAKSFGQRITIKKSNITVDAALKQIMNQIDYDIIYKDVNTIKSSINLDLSNVSLEEALDKCLIGLKIKYNIQRDNKLIFLTNSIPINSPSIFDRLRSILARIDVRGVVTDSLGHPISGVTITIKGAGIRVKTNENGYFFIANVDEKAIVVINYIGFVSKEIKAVADLGTISLKMASSELDEVNIVSTGFQVVPKERATGAFTQIDNQLINRSVGPNILNRLNGVTSGLIFTKSSNLGSAPRGIIEVRGRSTLFSNAEPLVILDNFPYEGNLENINPNDIESITLLKDAAAASAWGTKSGNGVIVITTKKGNLNSEPIVNLNANINIGNKPDLYYQPQLSSSDYIEVEKFLFDKGVYVTLPDFEPVC